MTREDINNIISIICPNDEDFEKPIISPAYLKKELETLALEEEPSGDLISREDTLTAFADYVGSGMSMDDYDALWNIVTKMPSVNPQEPKTGHWEWVQYNYNPQLGNWHCSECRCVVVECVGKEEKGGIPLYKYCPQCGAKMEVSE